MKEIYQEVLHGTSCYLILTHQKWQSSLMSTAHGADQQPASSDKCPLFSRLGSFLAALEKNIRFFFARDLLIHKLMMSTSSLEQDDPTPEAERQQVIDCSQKQKSRQMYHGTLRWKTVKTFIFLVAILDCQHGYHNTPLSF